MNPTDMCINCFCVINTNCVCPICGYDESLFRTDESTLSPRTMLNNGQYLLGRPLGVGGFGITYLAQDTNLETRVAVKEYMPQGIAYRTAQNTHITALGSSNKDFYQYGLEKFLEEARALARFQVHPGIVSIFNFFKENGTAYIVMEFIDGCTIKEYLQPNGGKLEWRQAIRFAIPILYALNEIHKDSLIHRDISPDNIFVCSNGQIKILDFGAARYALREQSNSLSVILKHGYAPFEQYSTKGYQGPWTDVYAVGATIFRMVTGQNPPDATERVEIDPLYDMIDRDINIPYEAKGILKKSLAFKVSERYQDCKELADALELVKNSYDGSNQVALPASPSQTEPFVHARTAFKPVSLVQNDRPPHYTENPIAPPIYTAPLQNPKVQALPYENAGKDHDLYVVVLTLIIGILIYIGLFTTASNGLLNMNEFQVGILLNSATIYHLVNGIALYRIGKNVNYNMAWLAWVPIIQHYVYGKLAGPVFIGKTQLNMGIPLVALIILQIISIKSLVIYWIVSMTVLILILTLLYKFLEEHQSPRARLYVIISVFSCSLFIPFFLFSVRNKRPYYMQ